MTRVTCRVEDVYLPGDYSDEIPSVEAICTRCRHVTESYGSDLASVRRCFVLMRPECPRRQDNFYVAGNAR